MKIFTLYFFLFIAVLGWSQKSYRLNFTNEDYKILKKNPTTIFKDSLSALTYAKEFKSFGIKKGFLLASVDSMYFKTKELSIHFYLGPKFKSAKLSMDETDLQFYRKFNIVNEKLINNLDFNPNEIANLLQKMQQTLENNGFPFAAVSLNKIEIDSLNLKAHIQIIKGKNVRWTKINLKGENLSTSKLIGSYIHIKTGDLYNQSDIQLISARLKQISFLEEIKPAEILFTKEGAELFLYLKSKPVSLANGVIGLQPNQNTNKVSITGDIRLKLVNVLKRAEMIDLNWKSLQAQTQSLKAQLNVPNLFKSPFGIDGQFQLYKRDSSFLELKSTAGIQYALNNGSYLKAFYRNNSSSVLRGGKNNPAFSKLGTVQTNAYGLALFKQNIDYLPNPSRGISILLDASVGLRKSRSNDTAQLVKNTTYRGEIQLNWFIPLAKRHILRLANQTEFYIAPTFYQNEAFRFGGQISQRGFNEEELRATTRAIFTAEYRFLVDRNSFAFIFFDQSWYENRTTDYYNDHPFGFGTGFSFGTKIGTFSISYALGKQFGNPILIRDGKVHFGYIAYF
jgi:outer membrane protein assembly factor BamA